MNSNNHCNSSQNMSTNSTTKVTLQSKLTAVSSKPIGSGRTHVLSGLDHAMGFHTLHMIFYYKDEDNVFGYSFDLDPLRESLSEVLTMYPTMTGRLARGQDGNWEVKCNDAGVRVIKATVDATLEQWLTSASASQEACLVAWEYMPDDPTTWSPFRIQISSFEAGGVAIGLSFPHMLADLTCAASFFKSWTEAHRNTPITNPPSFTPLPTASPPPPPPPPPPPTKPQTLTTPKNMAKATFNFSNSVMKHCLSKFRDTCPDATPFDFLSALFWTRVALLKPPPENHDGTHSLSVCTDFRRLLKPPLPFGYFGNALHFSTVSLNAKDVTADSDGLEGIVGEMHRHVAGLEEEEIWSSIERFESELIPRGVYGTQLLTCVSMEHIAEEDETTSLLYGAMFSSDERPAHVSCHVGDVGGEGLIVVLPSPEGGLARTVTVTLPEELVVELCNDQAILELEPTMFFADGVAGR